MKGYKIMGLILAVSIAVFGILFSAHGQEKPKPEQPGMTIVRLVVGTGVENREPAGVSETFPATTEQVYCFLEVTGISADTEISFVWIYGEKELLKTNLPLKMGPRWRTYANKNLMALKGDWKVEVRDAGGNLLKDVKFKVE